MARIHAACAIADDALAAMLPRLADGPTERDFALELEVEMRRRGASGNSFDPIVASGPERGEAARASERAHDRARRARRHRLRLHRRRLLLRHDAHGERRRSRRRRAPRVGRRAREPMGGTRSRARGSRLRGRRPCVSRRDRRPRVGPTRSCTEPGTVSASRSTRRRGSPRVPVIRWNPARSSPSSPACTSPAWAACASRTRWSSRPTAPIPSPHFRRNSSCEHLHQRLQERHGPRPPAEGLVTVVEFQHVKPGKGGAFVRTKLKKVAGGAVLDRTFRADEKVPLAVIDKREMQYLYREGDGFVFMDNETYDQLHVEKTDLGGSVELPEGGRHRDPARCTRRRVVGIELPAAVELTRHQDRTGRAGRPRLGRAQAGHPRDRPRRAGAVVRRARRDASRSTPAPGSTWRGPDGNDRQSP